MALRGILRIKRLVVVLIGDEDREATDCERYRLGQNLSGRAWACFPTSKKPPRRYSECGLACDNPYIKAFDKLNLDALRQIVTHRIRWTYVTRQSSKYLKMDHCIKVGTRCKIVRVFFTHRWIVGSSDLSYSYVSDSWCQRVKSLFWFEIRAKHLLVLPLVSLKPNGWV